MDMTPRLNLPYIAPQQAQKQVTYNEAMRRLDMLVHPVVKSRSLAVPPVSPAEGDAYLVAASPSGAWAGKAGRIAAFLDGGWLFTTPLDGWLLYVEDDAQFVQRQSGTWAPLLTELTALSGYATGSWTPGISFGGNAVGASYGASNSGRYTRIGRLCIATFHLHLAAKGSSVGAAQVTGLPFAALASNPPASISVGWSLGLAGLASPIQGVVPGGGTTVALYATGVGISSALTHNNFGNTSQIQAVAIYDVA